MTTYKGKTAVRAPADLRLIGVDEDARVAEGTAAAVAGHDAVVRPADGLLVDQVDGSIWARLFTRHGLAIDPSTSLQSPKPVLLRPLPKIAQLDSSTPNSCETNAPGPQ